MRVQNKANTDMRRKQPHLRNFCAKIPLLHFSDYVNSCSVCHQTSRTWCIILSPVACLALQYFFHIIS